MAHQHDAAEEEQDKLKQELYKMSAWGHQIADLVAVSANLSEDFDKFAASRPPGPGVSLPEQHLRQLSGFFHEVHPLKHACVFEGLCCSQACVLISCVVLGMMCLLWR